jgi:hypothetical protein
LHYPPRFFDLNLRFASRMAEIGPTTWTDALLQDTHLFLAFGLGRPFDATHPVWQAFLLGLAHAPDTVAYTYDVYVRLRADQPSAAAEPGFGCFSYALWPGGRVRLHFRPEHTSGSPLVRAEAPARRAELGALFRDVRHTAPEARTVVGGSWLYNIPAYRRLFPPEYLATAAEGEPETQFIALWGQFLTHDGNVKEQLAQSFLARVQSCGDLATLRKSFPYPVLRLEAPIAPFFAFYST